MSKIKVMGFDGEYKVIENLGYSHDRACYAKVVLINNEEHVVISPSLKGVWKISKPTIMPFPNIRGQ